MPSTPARLAPTPQKTPAPATIETSTDVNPMPFNCQSCVRRKVKCCRSVPICTSCTRYKLECVYKEPPPPQRRKRKRTETDQQRLARYESILFKNNLLPLSEADLSETTESPRLGNIEEEQSKPVLVHTPTNSQDGRGSSLYLSSQMHLDARKLNNYASTEPDGDIIRRNNNSSHHSTPSTDPLSSMLRGPSEHLTSWHPTHWESMQLWNIYTENVDPICRVLHIPTTSAMVRAVSQQPDAASRAHECLLFAIYHMAIYSTTDSNCMRIFSQPRSTLLTKYETAAGQALVNAEWLATTDVTVLQAYALFLIAGRAQINRETYWILTGVAMRIAQRMGLHRDGDNLGISPFDAQMRRRLFWHLLPLDGYAGQFSGTGISLQPNSWDTKQPLNINDDQIYPGMTQQPTEKKGASEMIFFLVKTELTNLYNKSGIKSGGGRTANELRESAELDKLVDGVEETIESKYLRYCDVSDPLHLLVMSMARSGANVVRLRGRMSSLLNNTISVKQHKELYTIACKIVDTDITMYNHGSLSRFYWHLKSLFLWDAMTCILLGVAKAEFLSAPDQDKAWHRIASVYANHPDYLEKNDALHEALRKVTLKAWHVNPPTESSAVPNFMKTLYAATVSPDDQVEADRNCEGYMFSSGDMESLFNGIVDGQFNFGGEVDLDWSMGTTNMFA